MTLKFANRVRETTTITGTGQLTLLGAVAGFQSFAVVGDGNTCYYTITDPITGDWEVGRGTYTASGTKLSRDRVFESSNSNALVSFAGNNCSVFLEIPASLYQNDYGDGSDGAVTISTDTNWENNTVADDTGYVLKQFTSLTINSGKTVTANHRSQVLVVKVTGNCTINGTLHMDKRGAAATPDNDIVLGRYLINILGERALANFSISQVGAAGGAAQTVGTDAPGNNGSNGILNQTGGGGGGAGGAGYPSAVDAGGAGAAGTCFCGGSGGGGGGYFSGGGAGTAGAAHGGAGGNGGSWASSPNSGDASGGGAGNPVGTGSSHGTGSVTAPTGGGGGTLILVVGGNLTIGGSAVVSADGGAGGAAAGGGNGRTEGGGGAGGGVIIILYAGTLSNSGSVHANGGAGGIGSGGALTNRNGGAGGNGSIIGPIKITGA